MAVKKTKERRTRKTGRRSYEQAGEYFLDESSDRSIKNDRRRVPDRRTGSVEVEWIEEEHQVLSNG